MNKELSSPSSNHIRLDEVLARLSPDDQSRLSMILRQKSSITPNDKLMLPIRQEEGGPVTGYRLFKVKQVEEALQANEEA